MTPNSFSGVPEDFRGTDLFFEDWKLYGSPGIRQNFPITMVKACVREAVRRRLYEANQNCDILSPEGHEFTITMLPQHKSVFAMTHKEKLVLPGWASQTQGEVPRFEVKDDWGRGKTKWGLGDEDDQ